MTPTPPGSACAWRAGVGFTMSKSRNSRKARASTGGVNGSRSTASVISATSSMTIAPGSLAPSARSACWAAHVPITATATKNTTSPARENGTIQSTTAVSALATVPGATGAQPTPPTVARATATRSRRAQAVPGRDEGWGVWGAMSGPPTSVARLADELVAFHLGDAHAREAPRREGGAVAEIDDAVDLGRLAGGAAFPRERGILARPVHEDVEHRADALGVAVERDRIVQVLHDGGALGGHLRVDLVGKVRRRRPAFGRVREHAKAVEARLVEEAEQVVEGGGRLAGEADEHRRAQRDVGERVADLADDVEHAPRSDRAPHGAQHAVVAVLHRHVHVGHDARARELVERAVVDVRGMQVHRPDPGHPRVLAERQQQVADVAVAGEVTAVRERVLP